jgi:hypothetical protein
LAEISQKLAAGGLLATVDSGEAFLAQDFWGPLFGNGRASPTKACLELGSASLSSCADCLEKAK